VLWSDVFKAHGQNAVNKFACRPRQANRSWLGPGLHTSRHIHAVAEQVSVADHSLANVQSDPKQNPTLLRNLLVHGCNPLLDPERALQRINCTRELGQYAVSGGVGDPTAVLRDEPVRHLAMRGEQSLHVERPNQRSAKDVPR